METHVIAYYAGFFDGEGSVFVQTYKDRHGKERKRLTATLTQVDRLVLDNLVELLGCGKVYEKGDKRALSNGWKLCYSVRFTDRQARLLLSTIEPFLLVKKQKVSELLDEFGRDTVSRK